MFEYFPGHLHLEPERRRDAELRRPDRRGRPRLPADQGGRRAGEDAGTPDFLRAWTALTDQLVGQAEDAEKAGHTRTAGQLYFRASNYLARPSGCSRTPTRTGCRPTGGCWSWRRRPSTCTARASPAVEIPYEGTTLPAYFSQAPATDDGPAPVIVLVNGLDSTKEHMYSSGHWAELAARGISCLMLDQPGTGEALRLQGLTARIDTEAWAGAAVD